MKRFMMDGALIVMLISLHLTGAAQLMPESHWIPQGIQSVNGSSDNVTGCGSTSCVLDGNIPSINTTDPNWASQLETVRKNDANDDITFAHVVLTFSFSQNITLRLVELYLLYCPKWKIGAPYISLYGNHGLRFTSDIKSTNTDFLDRYRTSDCTSSSCDSLSLFNLNVRNGEPAYSTYHIVISDIRKTIDWVHVGEVRFFDKPANENEIPQLCPEEPSPDPSTPIKQSSSVILSTRSELSDSVILPTPTSSTSSNSSTLFVEPLDGDNTPLSTRTHATTTSLPPIVVVNPIDNSKEPTEKESPLLVIAIVVGIVIFILSVFILAVTIVFCIRKKRRHSARDKFKAKNLQRKSGSNKGYELHALDLNVFSEITKALSIAVPNAISSSDKPFIQEQLDETFTVSHRELSMPNIVMENEEEGLLKYEDNQVVPPNISDLKRHLATLCSLDNGSQQSEEEMQMHGSAMPSDLERNLAAFDEHVYCEPFRVSDFTDDGMEVSEAMGEESDPHICAPIYTVPSTLTDGAQGQVPIEIATDNFKEVRRLGIGQFGQVILASASGLGLADAQPNEESDEQIFVVMKSLKPHPSQVEREAFNKERNFMSQLSHPNVLLFLGACSHDPTIILGYTKEGDLYHFLQRYTDIVSLTTPSNSTQISTSTIVYMASQIASAMQYLAQQKFVHRDLATRNCLVGENFTIKVADLGVNLDLYQSHYYKIRGNRLLPIRWMATECFDGKFSEKSDIWAFGITLWELFTLSKDKPYPNLSDEEVIENSLMKQDCQLPPRPTACPPAVYEIMHKCWIINLRERATFKEVNASLQKYL